MPCGRVGVTAHTHTHVTAWQPGPQQPQHPACIWSAARLAPNLPRRPRVDVHQAVPCKARWNARDHGLRPHRGVHTDANPNAHTHTYTYAHLGVVAVLDEERVRLLLRHAHAELLPHVAELVSGGQPRRRVLAPPPRLVLLAPEHPARDNASTRRHRAEPAGAFRPVRLPPLASRRCRKPRAAVMHTRHKGGTTHARLPPRGGRQACQRRAAPQSEGARRGAAWRLPHLTSSIFSSSLKLASAPSVARISVSRSAQGSAPPAPRRISRQVEGAIASPLSRCDGSSCGHAAKHQPGLRFPASARRHPARARTVERAEHSVVRLADLHHAGLLVVLLGPARILNTPHSSTPELQCM